MKASLKVKFPSIGLRIVKSAIAVFLCFLVGMVRQGNGMVFYSQLAALWCMQTYKKNTRQMAIQRTIGTIIGAIYGLIVILFNKYNASLFEMSDVLYALLISIMIALVIYTTVVINKKQASYFSCVVFLSIVINHLGDQNPYLFVWNRFLDTMIGIAIGIGVNSFHIRKQLDKETLFISGLDDKIGRAHV